MPAQEDRTQKRCNVIEIHFKDNDDQVVVTPPDRNVMAMSVETAIEACRAFHNQIVFNDQFNALVSRLTEWLASNDGNIDRAYLTTRDTGLLFLVVLKSKGYDCSLESSLTDLDIEIANDEDYNLIVLSVLAIPSSSDDDVHSFLSGKMIVRFTRYGDRE